MDWTKNNLIEKHMAKPYKNKRHFRSEKDLRFKIYENIDSVAKTVSLFCCYTVLTSSNKDETAVYGYKSWLVLGSYSYRLTDKFLVCVVHQSCNQLSLYY